MSTTVTEHNFLHNRTKKQRKGNNKGTNLLCFVETADVYCY
jgi:hypothetical protein